MKQPSHLAKSRHGVFVQADVALSGAHVSTPCMSTITQSNSHLLNKRFASIVG